MKYFIKKSFLLLFVVVLAALIIFYRFPDIPQNISVDELEFAQLALSLDKHPVIYSPLATGHTTPYYFFILAAFKIFGISVFALRLPAAIFGVLNSVLIYILLSRFFKTTAVVFFGTIVFLSLRWNFQFARFAFEASYLLFWELLSAIFILKFIDTHKKIFWLAALLTTTIAFYSYLPGRIFFVIPLILLLFKKSKIKYVLLFLLFFALAAIPLIVQTNIFESRIQNLTYLNNKNITFNKKVEFFYNNINKNLLMFSFKGDLNGRHNYPGKPALNPILNILLLTGFFFAFKKNRTSLLFFISWFLISLIPSLLTYPQENPHFLRTYTAIPALIFFITTAISRIWQYKSKIVKFLFLTLIVISALYELRTYFYYQTQVFPQAFEVENKKLLKLNFPR